MAPLHAEALTQQLVLSLEVPCDSDPAMQSAAQNVASFIRSLNCLSPSHPPVLSLLPQCPQSPHARQSPQCQCTPGQSRDTQAPAAPCERTSTPCSRHQQQPGMPGEPSETRYQTGQLQQHDPAVPRGPLLPFPEQTDPLQPRRRVLGCQNGTAIPSQQLWAPRGIKEGPLQLESTSVCPTAMSASMPAMSTMENQPCDTEGNLAAQWLQVATILGATDQASNRLQTAHQRMTMQGAAQPCRAVETTNGAPCVGKQMSSSQCHQHGPTLMRQSQTACAKPNHVSQPPCNTPWQPLQTASSPLPLSLIHI